MQKTVKELCLVCKGERWLPEPGDPARSRPCPYCDQLGWVEVSLASLGEAPAAAPPSPSAPPAPPAGEPKPPKPGPRKKP